MSNENAKQGLIIIRGIQQAEHSLAVAAKDTALLIAHLLDGSIDMMSSAKVGSDVLTDCAGTLSALLGERRQMAVSVHSRLSEIGREIGLPTAWVGDGDPKKQAIEQASRPDIRVAA